MTGRTLRSWWTYLGLTLASALIGHLIFDAIDDGLAAIVTRPIHLVYAAIVLAAFAGAFLDGYGHTGAERRRRIALMHSGLGNRTASLAGSIVAQLVLAGATLRLEDLRFDQPHVAFAALFAVLAVFVGALVLRRFESGLLRFVLAVFAARRPRSLARPTRHHSLAVVPSAGRSYGLFRPNRPPPLFA